jgi:hypothetical protein
MGLYILFLYLSTIHENYLFKFVRRTLLNPLSSFFCPQIYTDKEIPLLLERREKEGLKIIPVIVKPCPWKMVPWLSRLPVFPGDGIPLASSNKYQVENELSKLISKITSFESKYRIEIPRRVENENFISYRVAITQAGKENSFEICWIELSTGTKDCFVQAAPGFAALDIDRWRRNREDALDIGRELFKFLDGDARHLQRALADANEQGEPLTLLLCTCKPIADWPFELLAQGESFLLPHRLHLVRRMSEWTYAKNFIPADRPLKLLFMACSPQDVKPELDFEREEETIFHVTANLPVDMEVEDSGSLEGLRNRLERELYEVVHLSGHADLDESGMSFFVMEDDTGYMRKVTARELWQEALIENPPQLLFLSGSRTGEIPGGTPGSAVVAERLERVYLTGFKEAEQLKKVRELRNIYNYPKQEVVLQLMSAGCGNPRLMEWLDLLVGQMTGLEVPELLAAIADKKEEFIHRHVLRDLVQRGGAEMPKFLRRFCIYRRPVPEQGVEAAAGKAGIINWRELLVAALGLSLVENDQARQSYSVTPLLREELLAGLAEEKIRDSHAAAFAYYRAVCESMGDGIDPILVEEWIYHALACGEEEVASRQGGRLVDYLRERLAYLESRRVGEWIPAEKKQKLAKGDDAFLLNELAVTIDTLGDYRRAIEYYEQTLTIDRAVFGEQHPNVAAVMNNLGTVYFSFGQRETAKGYFEKAHAIFKKFFGDEHSKTKIVAKWLEDCSRD